MSKIKVHTSIIKRNISQYQQQSFNNKGKIIIY